MTAKRTLVLSAVAATLTSPAFAGFAVNLVPGRGVSDAPTATINDFITQNPDAGLVASDVLLNSLGPGGGSGFGDNFGDGVALGGFTITSSTDDGSNTPGTNSGINAGSNAHNDLNPITEGYAFGASGTVVTIDGLLANSVAGDTVVLGVWAIGDNINQDAILVANYGDNTATEGNSQRTLYNGPGEDRNSDVGSVPFVNFTFVADGVTDSISFALDVPAGNDSRFTPLNGFSLSVTPIPEPASLSLVGLGALALLGRRRKA